MPEKSICPGGPRQALSLQSRAWDRVCFRFLPRPTQLRSGSCGAAAAPAPRGRLEEGMGLVLGAHCHGTQQCSAPNAREAQREKQYGVGIAS